MRKLVSALLLFSLLGGCGPSPPAEPSSPLEGRSGNYDTTAVITYKELKATATISQESPESCLVRFASPDSLGDMAFVFRRDSVDVSYKGLAFQFDPQSLPGGAVAKVAVNAVNKAMMGDGVSLALTDAGMELTGMLEVGEFKLRLDADDGNLLKLSVPSEELEIEFVNFRFLD